MDQLIVSGSDRNPQAPPNRLPDQKTGIALSINGYGRPGSVNPNVPLPAGWREDVALSLLAEGQIEDRKIFPEKFDFGQVRVFVNDSTQQIGMVFRGSVLTDGRYAAREIDSPLNPVPGVLESKAALVHDNWSRDFPSDLNPFDQGASRYRDVRPVAQAVLTLIQENPAYAGYRVFTAGHSLVSKHVGFATSRASPGRHGNGTPP